MPTHEQAQSSYLGFKSRFSLLSLLPARHPPLVISHPAPALPTRTVHHARPILRSSDRVESSYGLTDDPFDQDYKSPVVAVVGDVKKRGRDRSYSVNGGQLATPKSLNPRRRPPPLNLARTKAAFPTVKGVTLVREDSPRSSISRTPPAKTTIPKRNESLPVVRGTGDLMKVASKAGRMFKSSAPVEKEKKERPRPKLAPHESYDFVTLEAEHQYPSWKGGKVDIRPGEHIPADLVPSLARSKSKSANQLGASKPNLSRQASSTYSPDDDQYESVLHNVLLTPTYFAPSTAHRSTTDLLGSRNDLNRRTLMDRAKDALRTVPIPTTRRREPEEKEMTRFPALKVGRQDTISRPQAGSRSVSDEKRQRTVSSGSASGSSLSTPSPAIRGVVGTPYKRSPAWTSSRDREESVGFESPQKSDHNGGEGKRPLVGVKVSRRAGDVDGKRSVSVSEAWREKKQKEQAVKRKRMMWRCGLGLLFIVLASVAIGVLVSQLTGKKASAPATSSSDSNSDTNTSPVSTTSSTTAPTLPAPTASNAPQNLKSCIEQYSQSTSNPKSYPCSECVPLLVSTQNDFETALVAGNSTNIGAALQFCALMDIYRAAPVLDGQGWAKEGGACGWQGVRCDDRGRVTDLILEYPNVPSTLSDSLGNIASLSSIKLLGNHSIPNGEIPGRLFQLRNLTELDLEYTALTGPLPDRFDGMRGLTSLTLVNNQQLGPSIPDLSSNGALTTLIVTGQGLKGTNFDSFPLSLTYIDLSFNNLEGTVPSLIQLTSLGTLYMTNNNFSLPPNSLPTSLQTLSLTSNPALKGSMPSTTCSNTNLRFCDLRNTDLAGSGTVSNSTTASASSSSAVGGGTGKTCGTCRFT